MHSTDEDLAEITQDFVKWSGGFQPNECPFEDVRRYIDLTLLGELDHSDDDKWSLAVTLAADLIAMQAEA